MDSAAISPPRGEGGKQTIERAFLPGIGLVHEVTVQAEGTQFLSRVKLDLFEFTPGKAQPVAAAPQPAVPATPAAPAEARPAAGTESGIRLVVAVPDGQLVEVDLSAPVSGSTQPPALSRPGPPPYAEHGGYGGSRRLVPPMPGGGE